VAEVDWKGMSNGDTDCVDDPRVVGIRPNGLSLNVDDASPPKGFEPTELKLFEDVAEEASRVDHGSFT
jgi:hypothetical protein